MVNEREYPPGKLERVQALELDMLIQIDRICRRHDLTYWIDGGTCLGAVRHHGFIPWDDDIDVGMPLEDFQTFCEYAKEELPEGIALHQMETDASQYVLWGKLYHEGTTFVESDAWEAGCDECVFVDIFPYIRLEEKKGDHGVGHLRRTQLWTKLIYIYRIKRPTVLETLSWRPVAQLGWSVIHGFLRLTTTQEWLMHQFKKACKTDHPSEWWGNPSAARPYPFHESTLMSPVELDFEGHPVFAPHDWNRFLTDLYHDYMELPPVEKRHVHTPLILDVGDGEVIDLR